MKVLTKRQILLLHSALIQQSGGADGIRDEGLLDSAVNTPFQTFADQELYPSLLEKAARLGFGLICNHPFIDGNKRIGTHAMMVFLDINQMTLSYEDDDLIETILRVASGTLDYNGLLDYLELCCTQMGMEVEFFQSNHEGDLIDEIQSAAGRADGIILNPGGYAHYSVAILDALRLCGVPAVEVLLSEPDEHEPFRKTDIVSFGCQGHFIGEGISGYLHAAAYLTQLLRLDGSAHTHLVM